MKGSFSIASDSKREWRAPVHEPGRYLRSLVASDSVLFEEGKVTCLNKSKSGLLLEVAECFERGDIFEATFPLSSNKPIVLEVCWSAFRLWRSGHQYYHVGCRRLFCP